MNTETPVVSATQLRKFYPTRGRQKGGVLAVESIDFELRQGNCLGIVGESGSGKTTIAKMLLGIEIPTAGTITVAGRDRSIPARAIATLCRCPPHKEFGRTKSCSVLSPT